MEGPKVPSETRRH